MTEPKKKGERSPKSIGEERSIATGALVKLSDASVGVVSPDQSNKAAAGVLVFINITAISGTTSALAVAIQGKDPVSGFYYPILTSAPLTTTGFNVLRIYPGLAAVANLTANDILPRNWRVSIGIAGTTPLVTATISVSLVE